MYIPVLKNRTIEMSVIKELLKAGLSAKTIPMFEIIQMKSRSNSSKTYIDEIQEIFTEYNHPFFLDIPKLNITSSTGKSIQEFMTLVNRQKNYAFDQLISCKQINGIIPVLSYNTKESLNINMLSEEIKKLHYEFDRIALRITPAQYNKIANFSSVPLYAKDYLLLDIDDKGHTNPAFKKIYKDILNTKKQVGFTTFIINSNKPSLLYNKNIIDGEPIEEIDNSILEMYNISSYKFDGFGDYACITNALPTSGGAISPAGIYYSIDGNFFVGYKGRTPLLSEFNDYIAPSIVASPYWKEFDKNHHQRCPGCKKIKDIADGASGKSQGMWKGITMNHYIYTVDQILNS